MTIRTFKNAIRSQTLSFATRDTISYIEHGRHGEGVIFPPPDAFAMTSC